MHDLWQRTRVVHDVAAIQKVGVAKLRAGEIGGDGDDLRPRRERRPAPNGGVLDRQALPRLDHHRGGDHPERLVAREEAVAPREQVALEPALAQMFAQDLEDPTVMGNVVVVGYRRADEAAVLDLEDGTQPVRVDLVRAEEPEVSLPGVPGECVAQKLATFC